MKFSIQTLAIALSVSVSSCQQVLRKNRHQKQRHLIDNNGVEQLKELAAKIGDELGVDIEGLATALKGSLQIGDETNLGPSSSLVGMMKGSDDTTSVYSKSSKSGKSCKSQKELPPLVSRVYTASNQPNNNNEVNVYERDLHTGKLSFIESVGTGGSGNQLFSPPSPPGGPAAVDDPLASTGSVTVAGKCLLVVNAGTNSISSFSINEQDELKLADTKRSGGDFPVSIAERDGLVYVLNVGGNGAILGFDLKQFNCLLTPIGNPIALDQDVASPDDELILTSTPAQIGFTPENNIIVRKSALVFHLSCEFMYFI